MKPTWKCFVIALAILVVGVWTPLSAQTEQKPAEEKLPPGRKLVRIEAMPDKIELKHRFDYRQILLTGVFENGETVDVTRMAKLQQPIEAVSVNDRGLVRAVADGMGSLTFELDGKSVIIPVSVSGTKQQQEVSFVRDIMPIMSKMGCNAGTCHGAAKGKNGFQLSLRGYDPEFDHRALTDDIMGRRFDRSAPDRSLMLLKPTGEVPHVGGVLTRPGEPYYEMLYSWIASGVKFDKGSPRVKSIAVFPPSPVIPLPDMKQQMAVIATYTDGTTRDVTAEAFITSSNTEIAKVDDDGLVTALRRGEAAMLARYEGQYAAAPLIVMGDRTGFAWQSTPEYNYVDTLVYEKLKSVKILPSDVCTDEEFVRRLYLDLTGLPPQPDDIRRFLDDPRPSREKRDALVEHLLGSPEFVDHWTNKWCDLLQVNSNFLGINGAKAFRDWIRKAVADNMPYDQFAYQILTATGSNLENPAAAYWKILRKPAEAMENTTHLFLAVRFNCNKCHDHPFERWTQNDYYELASYFAQVRRKEDPKYKGQKIGGTDVEGPQPLVEIIYDVKDGNVTHERTGEVVQPEFPYSVPGMKLPKFSNRREQLARWITSENNPYFAKSFTNRIWSYLMGVGLIEPVDDIRAGNPPTNPKLLDKLTEEFIKSGFNVRELMRVICKSRTYQHSIHTNKWNADDEINYSHALARRLPAEVLFDAIHHATGSVSRIPGLPPGARASEIVNADTKVPGSFLELLGRPPRESACECERSNSMLLGPVLNLVNGPVIANAITDPNNRIHKLLSLEKDNAKVVEELFLAILNRKPTPEEVKLGVAELEGHREEFKAMQEHKAKLQADLNNHIQKIDAKQVAWEESMKKAAQWHVLELEEIKSSGGAEFKKLPDGSVLASGKNETPDIYTAVAKTNLEGITAIRLEVLKDTSLPSNGPGRAPNGNLVLNEFKLNITPLEDMQKEIEIKFKRALADFSQGGYEVQKAIDNNKDTGWALSPRLGRDHVAVFEVKEKFGFAKGAKLKFTLEQHYNGKLHNIGRFRLSVTTYPPPVQLKLLPDHIVKILAIPVEKRTEQQKETIRNYHRGLDRDLPNYRRAVAEYLVPEDPRGIGAQDLAWALLNSRGFLFNH